MGLGGQARKRARDQPLPCLWSAGWWSLEKAAAWLSESGKASNTEAVCPGIAEGAGQGDLEAVKIRQ